MSFSNSIDTSFIIALIIIVCAAAFVVLCLRQLIGKLSPKKTALFMGLSLFVICICVVFIMSGSPNALFAPAAGTGSAVTGESIDNGIHDVRIREDDIYLDDVRVDSVPMLMAKLGELSDTSSEDESENEFALILTDDHAAARTWHDVENALTENSLTWQEERR
ncbi:MAG: hypothetical protein K6C95_01275 [Lachnospiraceae bacterium]|nr:hypothetical protein [Lachnospiraceae bacterium]